MARNVDSHLLKLVKVFADGGYKRKKLFPRLKVGLYRLR